MVVMGTAEVELGIFYDSARRHKIGGCVDGVSRGKAVGWIVRQVANVKPLMVSISF